MGRPTKGTIVQNIVQKLLDAGQGVTASGVAREAGVARQTAVTHLNAMVGGGELRRVGEGPATRYEEQTRAEAWTFPREGLEEHVALKAIRSASWLLGGLGANASSTFDYVLQEMVNNAIDHSRGTRVDVRLAMRGSRLILEVSDDGVGALANVREKRGLASELDAVQELSKGKTTTAPAEHTGQGIFFSARAVDRFELESGALRWTVDMETDDTALGQIDARKGTLVRCTLAPDSQRRLADVFEAYSDGDFGFTKTKTWVRLFGTGLRFLSRSEARRVCTGLEQFEEVKLDFKGVTGAGQSFCDELLRVWARAHPGTRLVPVNMVPAVEFMVRRAQSTV